MTGETILAALIQAGAPTVMAWVALRKLSAKSDEIHVLVNSNLTAVKAALEAAHVEIQQLREVLDSQEPDIR